MHKRNAWMLILLLIAVSVAQDQMVRFTVHAVLVDTDLNQKPVPRLALAVTALGAPQHQEITMKTGFDGKAEIKLAPGKYRITTPQATEFQGRRYTWNQEVVISGAEQMLELSNDNAIASQPSGAPASRDLTALFDKLKNSVVTVTSESREGSGFLVDPAGLVLTNNHIVESFGYLAVQFDQKRKVHAQLLAANADKDIAVLWVNISVNPDAVTVPLSSTGASSISVGEQVFTIGNPLGQEKVLTTGVISKIGSESITSDININHGNSGGPLLTLKGEVIGITTGGLEQLARIVPVEGARPLIEEARKKLGGSPPSAELLPVDPTDHFPADALRTLLQTEKAERKTYDLNMDQFDVSFVTPVLAYLRSHQEEMAAARKAAQRTGNGSQATVQPATLEEARGYRPVLVIWVYPKLGGHWGLKFKTAFQRMRLLCGNKEVAPIHPGRELDDFKDLQGRTIDRSFKGIYSYLPDAISPDCGSMALEIFSEKAPNVPITRLVDSATIAKIWADFEPYRKAHSEPGSQPVKNSP